MRKLPIAVFLGAALLFAACAHKNEEKSRDTTPIKHNDEPPSSSVEPVKPTDDGSKAACTETKVSFDFNSHDLASTAKETIERMYTCVKDHPGTRVTIEGNADERGTEEYNMALGDQRAQSVARYLERLGAERTKLKAVSFGKSNPECTDHDESCWARNRRATLKPSK